MAGMTAGRPAAVSIVIAGAVSAVVGLANWLTLGLLAYVSLGLQGPEAGIPAACVTMVVGGAVVAVFSRSAIPSGGLSSATVLIFAAGVVPVAASGADPLTVLAIAPVCVVLMGVFQYLIGMSGLGNAAKYVPQPVLAGFMNGVAVLVCMAQWPALLGAGLPRLPQSIADVGSPDWPVPFAIGLVTALSAVAVGWRWPRAPALLFGLAIGAALYFVLDVGTAWQVGPTIGAVPERLPFEALLPLVRDGSARVALLDALPGLMVTALLLAVVGSLESVLNMLSIDEQLDESHDPDRELRVFGLSNIVTGALGGLPVVYSRSRALVQIHAGSRRGEAGLLSVAFTLLLYVLGRPLIALLPLSVLAGLMLVVAWSLVDHWTRRAVIRVLRGEGSRALWVQLVLVAAVCIITAWFGFVAGVLLGLLLAMALFIRAMQRSLVRSQRSAAELPSRRVYNDAHEAMLGPGRLEIRILELEGALFFGNAAGLARLVDQSTVRFVVLDLRRISAIDVSGASVLSNVARRLRADGRRLMLAGVATGKRHADAFDAHADAADLALRDWHDDVDRAVEAAERVLLDEAGMSLDSAEVALQDSALARDLTPAQRERLANLMPERVLEAGERLFAEGDLGDELFVLTEGSVTVSSAISGQRYVSFSPGMIFGETAMLDGRGRTADAHADVRSRVRSLAREALAALSATDPDLAQHLMVNVARHLSERLRDAASGWRNAER
ncbi:hypothetical protein BH10PSE17_BH10PSE17_36820 [soil metagenome]